MSQTFHLTLQHVGSVWLLPVDTVFSRITYHVTPTRMGTLREEGREEQEGKHLLAIIWQIRNPVLPAVKVHGAATVETVPQFLIRKDKQNYHVTLCEFPHFFSLGKLLNKPHYQEPPLLEKLVENRREGLYQRARWILRKNPMARGRGIISLVTGKVTARSACSLVPLLAPLLSTSRVWISLHGFVQSLGPRANAEKHSYRQRRTPGWKRTGSMIHGKFY